MYHIGTVASQSHSPLKLFLGDFYIISPVLSFSGEPEIIAIFWPTYLVEDRFDSLSQKVLLHGHKRKDRVFRPALHLTAIFASPNHIRSTVPDNFRALKGDV